MITNRMNKYLILLIVGLSSLFVARAETIWHYNASFNSFHDFTPAPQVKLGEQGLSVSNPSDTTMLVLSKRTASDEQYRYLVRFTNSKAKKNGHASPACGMVLFYKNPSNYYTLEMTAYNTHPYDEMRDERQVKVSLYKVEHKNMVLVKVQIVGSDINLYDGINSLCVDVQKNTVNVLVGDKRLKELFTADIHKEDRGDVMGLMVAPDGEMQVERTVLSYEKCETTKIMTAWTKDKLEAHFAQSKNPFEGYWEYLDRDMDDGIARLGGKYRIALVATGDGFDIIYVSGAQVGKSEWRGGMLKGRLTKTIFNDNYKAFWIDSTFRPIDDDVNGFFESGVILDMSFPTYKSKIRFSKVL